MSYWSMWVFRPLPPLVWGRVEVKVNKFTCSAVEEPWQADWYAHVSCGHQPCNEFYWLSAESALHICETAIMISPKFEMLEVSGESFGRFCFASRVTCWKLQRENVHFSSLLTNPSQHLSHLCWERWTFLHFHVMEGWLLKNILENCQFSRCYSSLVVYATVAERIKY